MSFEIIEKEVKDSQNIIKYGLVPWDSEIFGFNVIEVTSIKEKDIGLFNKLIVHLEDEARRLNGTVICVKIPSAMRDAFYTFQKNGYVFIEETIRPYINDFDKIKVDYIPLIKYPLLKANNDRIDEIQKIAYHTFRHDRFHLDKNFDNNKASERYSIWVRNSLNAGDDIMYLDVGGRVAGFSIISINERGYLRLIGLDQQYKGRGLGINLLAATCQFVKSQGVTEFSTTTSFNNIEALNMYAACGFKFRDPVYVLHKWL